ncbi:MAG TPA: transcriptional regulator [Candidatus Tenderia sp.]|nr:transcriptional regulator [Candidatus Tenderia sp.]
MDLFDDQITCQPEQLLNYASNADSDEVERWENALAEFVDIWSSLLKRRFQFEPELAGKIARELAAETAHHRGGRSFYLPKDDRLRRALRDASIWQAFNGKNQEALAEKHRLTVTSIYMILVKQRKLAKGRNQPDMFGG